MSSCATIKSNKDRICIADFDKKIQIQTRSVKNSRNINDNAEVVFETIANPWSLVKTKNNRNFIAGVGIVESSNVEFYIRFRSDIDFRQELWVLYQNVRYEIKNNQNLNKQNNIMVLIASEKGSINLKANES